MTTEVAGRKEAAEAKNATRRENDLLVEMEAK